jgi:hypothetical protein
VDGRTLTRLRLAFVALGVVLLLPLALLVRSAAERLEEQRKLKHEVVAERIFDEMERELVALLERERARSSDAYAATNTRPETWAPFMVGYFVHDGAGARVTAADLLSDEREQAVASAAQLAWAQWEPGNRAPAVAGKLAWAQWEPGNHAPAVAGTAASSDRMLTPSQERTSGANEAAKRAIGAESKKKGGKAGDDDELLLLNPYSNQEAVLRKLNRAQTKNRAPSKDDVQERDDKGGDDPLSGMDDL